MKKWMVVLLTITILLLAAGCGSTQGDSGPKEGEGDTMDEGEQKLDPSEIPEWIVQDIQVVTEDIKKLEKVEIAFKVDGFEGNPYDPDEIDIVGEFTAPSGQKLVIPAFWYEPYKEFENLGRVKAGAGDWRLRFSPTEKGDWQFTVSARYKGYTMNQGIGTFTAADSDSRGFIRIEPKEKRRFIFENGEPYIAIGENVCWGSENEPVKDYKKWYGDLAENGGNYSRVWMATWGFALVWKETGLTDYTNRMYRAFELDQVMELAEREGIYTALVTLNHGQFSAKTNPEWENNPYNTANGGYLKRPQDFFTDERAKAQFKKRLRYIVARWGYSTHIFTWELFNEVNGTDGYNDKNVKEWHREMAEYLKSIDPYQHIVSSSTWWTDRPIVLDELDFINVHAYSLGSFSKDIPRLQKSYHDKYNKPVIFGEMGISGSGTETAQKDPEGIHFHQGLWAGMMGGGAGTGMTWWWDSYIAPFNLYYHFKPVSEFSKKVPWNDSSLKLVSKSQVKTSSSKMGFEGYANSDRAYLWIYDLGYSYKSTKATSFTNESIQLSLDSGDYKVVWFNTYTGDVISEEQVQVSGDGAALKMPDWSKDIALIIEAQ